MMFANKTREILNGIRKTNNYQRNDSEHSKKEIQLAVERTTSWAKRCKIRHDKLQEKIPQDEKWNPNQAEHYYPDDNPDEVGRGNH